jgi:hypothetical protein
MVKQELLHLTISDYLLSSSFCQEGIQREVHIILHVAKFLAES